MCARPDVISHEWAPSGTKDSHKMENGKGSVNAQEWRPLDLANSFRPLRMLNTMSKLLETLIKNRLNEELEERGGLHKHQYGFRRG